MTFLHSMAGRVFLVLAAGIIVSVAITAFLAHRERQHTIAQLRESRFVERVAELVALLESVPPAARREMLAEQRMMRGFIVGTSGTKPRGTADAKLAAALRAQLGSERNIAVTLSENGDCPRAPMPPPMGAGRPPPPDERPWEHMRPPPPHRLPPDGVGAPGPLPADPPPESGCQTISLELKDGTPISLIAPRAPLTARVRLLRWQWPNVLMFAGLVAMLAYAVARMATRPIARLAQAARRLGENIEQPPLDETSGPREVRDAAVAFNAMQNRIRSHLKERTHMLAAISHDLQTPLTRLRLRLEKVPDAKLRAKLIEDMKAMQDIVREGLDLAHSLDARAPVRLVDLDSFIDSVRADFSDAGMDVSASGTTGASIAANPTALRRCLTNIIENAVKYGSHARIGTSREGSTAVVSVRDGGPGIPDDQLEAVFEPFQRIESSRSRETGGTGLGLTIARNVAERLGGSLKLRNHPDGGLEAILRLPVTP